MHTYRHEIDGLRALAVLPVILFHAGFSQFSGGYVGVDVFFVISGYLITGLIVDEMKRGDFSLVSFYERRARRILPALFVVLLASTAMAWLWMLPVYMKEFSQSLMAVSAFVSNIFFWRVSGYFDTTTELKPLFHTWSLAVEEQFYLFFPILLIALWRFAPRSITTVLWVSAAVSLACAQWAVTHAPVANFYLLPSRGWELLIGALVAQHGHYRAPVNGAFRDCLGIVGLCMIAAAVFLFDASTPIPSVYALVPTVGTALILIFATEATIVSRLLSIRVLRGIGLISYSAYLWHQPLFAFARHRSLEPPSPAVFAALSVASLCLAYMSWRFVEKPFRNRRRVKRLSVAAFSIGGTLLVLSFGVAGSLTKGFEAQYVDRLSPQQLELYNARDYEKTFADLTRHKRCLLEFGQTPREFARECKPVQRAEFLVWGDSHAAAISIGLRHFVPATAQYTYGGCPPLLDTVIFPVGQSCIDANNFILAEIERGKPERVILASSWWRERSSNANASIGATIDAIKARSPATRIYIIGGLPQWFPSLPDLMISKEISINGGLNHLDLSLYGSIRNIDDALMVAAEAHGATFISALDGFCQDHRCRTIVAQNDQPQLTTFDYGHLTEAGSIFLARYILSRVHNLPPLD